MERAADTAALQGMYDFAVLRSLRKKEQMTIADVAAQSGVSPSVISRLERNRTRAELETIFRLSRVFNISTSELLQLAERPLAHRISESEHQSAGFTFRQIRYGNVRCLLGTASAGGWVSHPEAHAHDLELCWCLEGEVKLMLPEEQHPLKAGDAVQFDAILEHRYEAVSDCRLIVMHLTKEKRY